MRKLRFFTIALLMLAFAAVASLHAQKYSVLHNFGTKSVDLDYPGYPGIIAQGRDGNLYSTGAAGGKGAAGGIFKITPTGTFTVLQSLNVTDGNAPESGLTLAIDGSFYGAAQTGGTDNAGVIFKITPSASLRVLYNAPSGADESYPLAGLIQGTDGNFYGTTQGNPGGQVGGTVYKLTPSGKFTPLYSFPSDRLHGAVPLAPVVQGVDGNFYGTTEYGGNKSGGVVFKVTSASHLTVLYNFDGTHGAAPYAPVIQGNDGSFYGTTVGGGTTNNGVVFKITPSGKFAVLHSFNGTDGGFPTAGLVQATDGNFYGVTRTGGTLGYGTIYKISPHGSYSVLYNFDGTTGANPEVMLVQHTNGILYGDTEFGGNCTSSGGCGTFYSLNVGLKPFVKLVSTSGKVGQTVEILRTRFHGNKGRFFQRNCRTLQGRLFHVPDGHRPRWSDYWLCNGNDTGRPADQQQNIPRNAADHQLQANERAGGNIGDHHRSQPHANHQRHLWRREGKLQSR